MIRVQIPVAPEQFAVDANVPLEVATTCVTIAQLVEKLLGQLNADPAICDASASGCYYDRIVSAYKRYNPNVADLVESLATPVAALGLLSGVSDQLDRCGDVQSDDRLDLCGEVQSDEASESLVIAAAHADIDVDQSYAISDDVRMSPRYLAQRAEVDVRLAYVYLVVQHAVHVQAEFAELVWCNTASTVSALCRLYSVLAEFIPDRISVVLQGMVGGYAATGGCPENMLPLLELARRVDRIVRDTRRPSCGSCDDDNGDDDNGDDDNGPVQ